MSSFGEWFVIVEVKGKRNAEDAEVWDWSTFFTDFLASEGKIEAHRAVVGRLREDGEGDGKRNSEIRMTIFFEF